MTDGPTDGRLFESRALSIICLPFLTEACVETRTPLNRRNRVLFTRLQHTWEFATDTLRLLSEWNARCQPPWTEHELEAKLRHTRLYRREPMAALLRP
jgi:hypothetical protein